MSRKKPNATPEAPPVGDVAIPDAPEAPPAEDVAAPDVMDFDVTIENTGRNPHSVKGVVLPPPVLDTVTGKVSVAGGTYTLTESDLENELLMQKINHAVKLGVLTYVDRG